MEMLAPVSVSQPCSPPTLRHAPTAMRTVRPPTSSCPAQASLPALHAGLDDADDDVRAASADALVPLAPTLFSIGMPAVRKVRAQLWELLGKVRGGADGGEMRGGREVGGRVLA